MATCVHCHQRKGKRSCPALQGMICPACCGEHRLVEISCPSDCMYLTSNEPYQRRRQLSRAPEPWVRRIMGYERRGRASLQVMHALQIAACEFENPTPFDRRAAIEGLEFARRRMGLIETPEPYLPPFGEFLLKRLDELIKAQAPVEREVVREVLDETLRHLDREVSDETFPEFLRFLQALYADELAKKRTGGSGRIVLG